MLLTPVVQINCSAVKTMLNEKVKRYRRKHSESSSGKENSSGSSGRKRNSSSGVESTSPPKMSKKE